MKWFKTPMEGGEDADKVMVVIEAKCHDPSAWKLRALESASIAVSDTTAQILERVRTSLAIVMDSDDPEYIHTADFSFEIDQARAERFLALLAKPPKQWTDKKTGQVVTMWYTNAYRVISCEPIGNDRYRATARLALGEWKERKHGRAHALDVIPATTGLQQVINYAAEDLLAAVPRHLRSGVCQQVAQDVTSYIGQLESSRVRGDVAFPSTEDRHPERRRVAYAEAIDALVSDLEPLARIRKREAMPGKFADDDPEGDKRIIQDARWDAVMRSPEPHPIPLFFVKGDDIRLVQGTASFDAGISKRNRHRGATNIVSERVRADRPQKIRSHGASGLRQWYAAVPILLAAEKRTTSGSPSRGLPLHFHLAPIQGGAPYRPRSEDMLIPLSADEDRFFRVLQRTDIEIAWAKLIAKHGEWFLQLTLRMHPLAVQTSGRVLGVSFDLNAVATWVVLDEQKEEVASGALGPNEQILAFVKEKRVLEWDQAKGRWVGGHQFANKLEQIAHEVANQLLETANLQNAKLALEDLSYVQKSGPNHERNLLFSAWNFGQLPRIMRYKAAMAGSEAFNASDYVTRLTCPACGAIGNAKDAPEKAATRVRKEDGVLECRKCGRADLVTPRDRAKRAALHALGILADRKKRALKKTG